MEACVDFGVHPLTRKSGKERKSIAATCLPRPNRETMSRHEVTDLERVLLSLVSLPLFLIHEPEQRV